MGSAITVFPNDVLDDVQRYHLLRYYIARSFTMPGDRVLDLGFGTGYGTEILAHWAKWVIGVDFNKPDVEGAKVHHQKENINFICADLEQWEIPECDVAVCFEVMEHLYDWKKFLDRVKDKTKKYIIFSVPLDEPMAWDDNLREFNGINDHTHKSSFKSSETSKALFRDENWKEFINIKDKANYFCVLYNLNYFKEGKSETNSN